ncbi:hypothetical protein SMICM17S_00283 [Streptomyces microflavus]
MRDDEEWGSIPGLVREAARRYGPAEAVVEGRTRLTYAGLGDRVERAAAACMAAGVERATGSRSGPRTRWTGSSPRWER